MNRKFVFVACVLAGPAWASPARGAELKDGWEAVRKPAVAFALKDLAGQDLRSADLRGRIVVADFWATWCGPCIRELPDLQILTASWKDRRDVAFLSLNATEEKPDVVAFVKEKSLGYPVYLADDLVGPFEVSAFPTKLIIDMRGQGDGVVRFRRDGYTESRSIEARVRELLEERPGAATR